MQMPGFSAETVFQPPRAITRDVVIDGPNGPIIIEGNCQWVCEPLCFDFGGWCVLGFCVPSVKLCIPLCHIRCTPW